MGKRKLFSLVIVTILSICLFNVTASAAEIDSPAIKGYVWNPSTGQLEAYYNSPEECLPPLSMSEADTEPYINPIMPQGIARAFVSYSPTSYTYNYTNNLFKIGTVRVDNSKNTSSSANLNFTVERSGSCSITLTLGSSIGGEIDAIYAKAQSTFSAEVAAQVSWSAGTTVGTSSTVPPGKIGKVTGYVIGIYSAGTATYSRLNTTTDELTYEKVGIGALLPTTNAWNLVVEVPST